MNNIIVNYFEMENGANKVIEVNGKKEYVFLEGKTMEEYKIKLNELFAEEITLNL